MADLFGTYDKRIKLTAHAADIDADLTWFAVTVKLTSAQAEEVFTEMTADADFDRVAFTTSDESTELYADCELFDDSEQTAIYHVSKTGWILDDTVNTDFYMYYDVDAAHNTTYISMSGGTAAQSVWDANFKAVYHMAGTGESAIDVGAVTAAGNSSVGNITYIDKTNPANFTGKLTQVSILAITSMASAKVATFYNVAGNNFTARDVSANLGAVAQGATRTFTVDLNVVADDLIGIYFTDESDTISRDASTGGGVYWLAGDQTACTDATFAPVVSGLSIQLYGTGMPFSILDSTSNNNDGMKKAAGEPAEAAGQVGQAQDFDGTDDYINFGDVCDMGTSDFTVEAVIKANSTQTDAYSSLVDKDFANTGWKLYLRNSDGLMRFAIHGTYVSPTSGSSVLDDTLHHVAVAADRSGNAYFYVDGSQDGDAEDISAKVASNLDSGDMVIGFFTAQAFKDVMDEVRISSTLRSAAWEKATYASLWDTLLTYGNEETSGAAVVQNAIFLSMNF